MGRSRNENQGIVKCMFELNKILSSISFYKCQTNRETENQNCPRLRIFLRIKAKFLLAKVFISKVFEIDMESRDCFFNLYFLTIK